MESSTIHASAVLVGGHAILIRGPWTYDGTNGADNLALQRVTIAGVDYLQILTGVTITGGTVTGGTVAKSRLLAAR